MESNCGLQAYARYADGRAVLVLPNYADSPLEAQAAFDPTALGMKPADGYALKELFLDEQPVNTGASSFTTVIPPQSLAVILVEPLS